MKIRQKLKSRGGFTLAETLMAVLIMLLVSAIMAEGIPVARNAYEKVVLSANAQSLLSTTVAILRDELGTAWEVTPETDGSISYYSADTGARTRVFVDAAGDSKCAIQRQEYSLVAGMNTGEKSLGESQPLLSNAVIGTMTITCGGLSYSDGVVTVSNLAVQSNGGATLASVGTLNIRVLSTPRT